MPNKTLYDVLRVSRNADPETIKAAYKSLVQNCEKNPDRLDAEEYLKNINRVHSAYDLLSDPAKRAKYDATLSEGNENTATPGRKDSSDNPPRAAPAGNIESNKTKLVSPAIEIHPWRRLCARTLDYMLWMFVLSMLHDVGRLLGWASLGTVNPFAFGLAGIFFWIFAESILLSTYGTTPGKWLLNIFVMGENGDKEYLKSCALSRSWKVWLRGMCLGLPFICLVGYIFAYIGLKREGTTSWDRDEGLVVTYKPVGGIAWSVAVLIFLTSGFLQNQAIKNYNNQLDRTAAAQSQSQAFIDPFAPEYTENAPLPADVAALFAPPPSPAFLKDRGRIYFDNVLKNIKECFVGKTGTEVPACYVNGTPKKCQQQVLNHLTNSDSDSASSAWFICIASCADAGIWSSTFGECSR